MTFLLNSLINNLLFIIRIIMHVVSVSSISYLVLQKWQNLPENLQCPQQSNQCRFSMVKDTIKELTNWSNGMITHTNQNGKPDRVSRPEVDIWFVHVGYIVGPWQALPRPPWLLRILTKENFHQIPRHTYIYITWHYFFS